MSKKISIKTRLIVRHIKNAIEFLEDAICSCEDKASHKFILDMAIDQIKLAKKEERKK